MLRCIRAHEAPGFGTVPEGSLWEDDSPFVAEAAAFEPVATDEPETPAPVVTKFKTKKKTAARVAAPATPKGDDQ